MADEPVLSLNEKSEEVSTNFNSLNYSELEKRISELEKSNRELWEIVSKIKSISGEQNPKKESVDGLARIRTGDLRRVKATS